MRGARSLKRCASRPRMNERVSETIRSPSGAVNKPRRRSSQTRAGEETVSSTVSLILIRRSPTLNDPRDDALTT